MGALGEADEYHDLLTSLSQDGSTKNETHPFGVYSPCSTSSNYDSFKNYYNDNGKKPGALFAFRLGLKTESIEMDQIPKTIGDIKGINTLRICKPSKAELIDEIMRRRRLELQQMATDLEYDDTVYYPYPHVRVDGEFKKVLSLEGIYKLDERELESILENGMRHPCSNEDDMEENGWEIELMKSQIDVWVKTSEEETEQRHVSLANKNNSQQQNTALATSNDSENTVALDLTNDGPTMEVGGLLV